jgi:hypothetical protein
MRTALTPQCLASSDTLQCLRRWHIHLPSHGPSPRRQSSSHTASAHNHRPCVGALLYLFHYLLTSVSGVAGQYPASALVGYLVDRHGPHVCSLISALLFGTGFGFFSHITSGTTAIAPELAFRLLTFLFLLCGLATVSS